MKFYLYDSHFVSDNLSLMEDGVGPYEGWYSYDSEASGP